jgi:hypothetical protein
MNEQRVKKYNSILKSKEPQSDRSLNLSGKHLPHFDREFNVYSLRNSGRNSDEDDDFQNVRKMLAENM